MGRDLAVVGVVIVADDFGGGDTRSAGGGVILTLGEVKERFPKTELPLLPPRRQDEAVSDLDGVLAVMLFEAGLPREVPPLMTVVEPGVGGRGASPSSGANLDIVIGAALRLELRLPNLPPRAAVIGT
jgi:hypothetical protein